MTSGGRVQGKVALVTGAARGMGLAISRRLAEEGADIIALDMGSLDDVTAAVKDAGREIGAIQVDARDLEALQEAFATALAKFGRIDVAAINHGTAAGGRSWEIPPEEWYRLIDINLTSVWNVARTLIPILIEQGNGGAIALTGSTTSVAAVANMAHYVASKHGVLGLARSLAIELGPHLVRVNTIMPGSVDTPLLQEARAARLEKARLAGIEPQITGDAGPGVMPIGLLDSVDIANAALWLLSDEARYVTGVALAVDAGSLIAPSHRS